MSEVQQSIAKKTPNPVSRRDHMAQITVTQAVNLMDKQAAPMPMLQLKAFLTPEFTRRNIKCSLLSFYCKALSLALNTLIHQAKDNRFPPDAFTGGTITISNIGPFDGATTVQFNNAWMRYLMQSVLMLSELR